LGATSLRQPGLARRNTSQGASAVGVTGEVSDVKEIQFKASGYDGTISLEVFAPERA